MGYPAIPLSKLLQYTVISWSLYACFALVLVVAVTVAVMEHRERRRLERALTVARQLPPFRKKWTPEPAPGPAPTRLWLFPTIAIVIGLIVAVWSIWNVLD
ncbi:MAG: hypothetical protein OXG74_16845 [Acidobacteria bacterium]|nr:hypothetical protein [Acidobacteriota bacterium]